MGKINLIIQREYTSRVFKKSFILMTLLTPIIMLALTFVPLLLSEIKDTDTKSVAVIDETGKYGHLLVSNETYEFINVTDASSNTVPEDYMNDNKDHYGILIISDDLLVDPSAITFYSDKTANMGLKQAITNPITEYLKEEKIKSYDIPELKEIINSVDVNLELSTIKFNEDGVAEETSADVAMIIGFMFTFLIYIFIFAYGGMIINSVIQEKTSRIIEVMISSVKPFELMMGKIIAVGCVGLTQFVIWIAIVSVGYLILGSGAMMMSDPTAILEAGNQASMNQDKINMIIAEATSGIDIPLLLGSFILYFIGGYLLYASIFAAIGSLVDQEADSQQFMIPVTMIILFAFYAAIYSIENPDGPLAFWCSMIPFTSPIVMMVRIPYDISAWELILSLSLLFGTFIGTTFIASKIYRVGILMYGKKPTVAEIIKWLKY